MRNSISAATGVFLLVALMGCAEQRYPASMTQSERAAYYRDFNASKTEAEWAQLRAARAAEAPPEQGATQPPKTTDRNPNSVSFSIENNRLLPQKLSIVDNVLTFRPFEVRYVGFEPNTPIFLLKGKRAAYLFTVSENDEGKTFQIGQ